ncbi:EF hand protein (macronuclear) [Tetrahymena thermophila SB210]|uniref:EF hand protein n=1 Tax=Tetrahymena thermophila (strain SB210) TaxID=312017 RepID=I7MLG3_TETTS|nr:EF hand protein [Tetrahymena thermophila SB210]EAS02044.2 EF hand protein [Tetrahymena thermophila SB210]|eukprot:XP_001022289.2 EF hand protein [Tetrahymena thermophila SB210]
MRNSHPYISSPGKKIEEQLQNPKNYLAVRPLQVEYDHERFKNIKHEFKIMDKDNNGFLSQEEILNYLKYEKQVRQINMKVIQELFDSMDTNSDGRVSLEEFAHNYISRESELKREIQLYQEQINNLEDEKNFIISVINNRYRINLRYLKISLEQANLSSFKIYQKLYETESFSVKAIVFCDKVRVDQMNEISTKLCQNITFPAWHETIQFEIDNLLQDNEIVQVQIKFVKQTHENERRISNDTNQIQFAESIIKITNLSQEYHEDSWIDVVDAKDKNIKIGVVHIKVDYIPNEFEYRKNRLEEIESELKDLQEQKQFREMEQEYLKRLFGTIQHSTQQIRKRSQIEEDDKSDQDFFSTFAFTNYKQSAISEFDFHEAFKLRDYGVYVLVAFNIILCLLERCDFLGLIILLRVMPFIRKNWTDKEIYFFVYMISFSALIDLFYLIFLKDGLSENDYLGRYAINLLGWIISLIYFILKCSFASYFIKIQNINLSVIFGRNNEQSQEDNSINFQQNNNNNNNNINILNGSQYKSQLQIPDNTQMRIQL